MKKVFFLVVFFAVLNFSFSFGQISYEASYYPPFITQPRMQYFNHISPKWMLFANDTIRLYHKDHSLFRQIQVPPQPLQYGVYNLSDNLFDTDSSNIEFIIATGYSLPIGYVKVYREDGTLLFSRDSAFAGYIQIFPSDSGTKMVLGIYTPYYDHTEVYSLPGTLPCQMICGGVAAGEVVQIGIEEYRNHNSTLPYPNPSSSQTHIPYTLPQGEASGEIIFYDMAGAEVRRYKVDKTFNDLILSTSDLSAGSYYYQLVTQHSKSEGRKLIVIK